MSKRADSNQRPDKSPVHAPAPTGEPARRHSPRNEALLRSSLRRLRQRNASGR